MSSTTLRPFSDNLKRLGTETAYAVSAEAKALSDSGKKIYNFHIGDIDVATPEVIKKKLVEGLFEKGLTGYCPAAGISELRQILARNVGMERNVEYGPENVSIQPGGKPVIGKFLRCVMHEGDEVLYPSPGYPIYESLIRYYGGVPVPYRFKETDEGFELDLDYIKERISPKTSVFIYNNYQNPVGCASSAEEMEEIANLCNKHNLWVLSDEAYFDMLFEAEKRSIVSYPGLKERTLILYTFSKAFSMTGWRLGAAIGPVELVNWITKFNTNDEACTTHFIQYAGLACFTPEAQQFKKDLVGILRDRRDAMVEELAKVPGIKAYSPPATFYIYANCTEAMKMCGTASYEEFRKLIVHETGVSFCTREHFGKAIPGEDNYYVRFAFSGIDIPAIREGIGKLADFLKAKVQQ